MSDHLFHYCERGHETGFWAEPLNALSNMAFLIAGFAALWLIRGSPRWKTRTFELFLTTMLFVIGAGSFLFHTFATRWAERADQIPITIFMVSYLAFVLLRLLKLTRPAAVVILAVFAAAVFLAGRITCPAEAGVAEGWRCLWGSVGYLPALAALVAVGWRLWQTSHGATRCVIMATAMFAISLTIRTLDMPVCAATIVGGRAIGTHFVWHALNAC